MMKIRCIKIIWAGIITCFFGVNIYSAALQKEDPGDVAFIEKEESGDDVDLYVLYMKGVYFHTTGKLEHSIDIFKKIFELKPPLYVYDEYVRLLFDMRSHKRITELYEKYEELFIKSFKDSLEVQLCIAHSYLLSDQDEKAAELFEKLAKQYPDDEQVCYYAAVSLIKVNKIKEALAFLDACTSRVTLKAKHFLFYFLKSRICLQQNKFDAAREYIEKSLKLFPKFDRGWLLKAMLLEQQGFISEAISGYKQFLNLVGREESIERQLIQLLFSQGRYDEGAPYLQLLSKTSPNFHLEMAMSQFNLGNYARAEESIKSCFSLDPKMQQAKLLYIDILLAQKKHNRALSFIKALITQDPEHVMGVHLLLLLKKTPVGVARVLATLEELVGQNIQSLGILTALADTYTECNEYTKGMRYYKKIFTLTHDRLLKSKILFQMGYNFFMQGAYDKMERVLKKALTFNPVVSATYNLLAYYYAQQGEQLPYALQLVEKALELDPQSPYCLDTKGVILFKLGRKDEAYEILERALMLAPTDRVIMLHLGMVKMHK